MRDVPDDKKKEVISRWLNGDYKDKISSEMNLSAGQVTFVINEWKREIGSAIAEAYRGIANSGLAGQEGVNPSEVIQAFKIMLSIKKFGIEPQQLADFTARFSKIAMSGGLEPEGLASIVNQILKLAELDGIEIHQLPAHLESLQNAKKELETEVEKFKEKRDSLSKVVSMLETAEPSAPQLDDPSISQLVSLSEQFKHHGLSIDDISAFADMIDNAKKYDYDFASIIDFLSSLTSLEQERNRIKLEIDRLGKTKETMLETKHSLEEELLKQQETLESVSRVAQMGLDKHDFEQINDLIRRFSTTNNLYDKNLAKQKFFEDLRSIYSDKTQGKFVSQEEQQLVKSQVETSEYEHEQKSKYGKELLDMVNRLISKGITEQTLMKCLIINEIFKLDLDTLADDLKKYANLKEAAKRIEAKRSRMESEELVLKHKILALEERRQQAETTMKGQRDLDNDKSQRTRLRDVDELLDLTTLIKAARGENQDIDQQKLEKSIIALIDLVAQSLDPNSLTKKILDHAKFSLQHEPGVPHNSV